MQQKNLQPDLSESGSAPAVNGLRLRLILDYFFLDGAVGSVCFQNIRATG